MSKPASLGSGALAALKGSVRVAGILGLILFLSPLQFIILVSHRGDSWALPIFFHRCVLRLLSFEVRVHGAIAVNGPVLYVPNHSSYLDVIVLGSILRASFVAKSEVEDWPVIGALAKLQQTAFVERRAVRAAEQRDDLHQRLLRGQSIVLFPEGTSSDGQQTLPFKSSLFGITETEGTDSQPISVQPITILCTELGGLPIGRAWRPYYAWFGDMTLVGHLWHVLKLGHFTIDVAFYEPVMIKDFPNRKALAAHCRHIIAQGVEQCLTGRPFPDHFAALQTVEKKLLA